MTIPIIISNYLCYFKYYRAIFLKKGRFFSNKTEKIVFFKIGIIFQPHSGCKSTVRVRKDMY